MAVRAMATAAVVRVLRAAWMGLSECGPEDPAERMRFAEGMHAGGAPGSGRQLRAKAAECLKELARRARKGDEMTRTAQTTWCRMPGCTNLQERRGLCAEHVEAAENGDAEAAKQLLDPEEERALAGVLARRRDQSGDVASGRSTNQRVNRSTKFEVQAGKALEAVGFVMAGDLPGGETLWVHPARKVAAAVSVGRGIRNAKLCPECIDAALKAAGAGGAA